MTEIIKVQELPQRHWNTEIQSERDRKKERERERDLGTQLWYFL